MSDPRVRNLARVLTRYCVKAGSAELVALNAHTAAEPLIIALYEELLRTGAYPHVHMMPEETSELFYRLGKAHHFDSITSVQRAVAREIHGSINILSSSNTRALNSVDPKKQARVSKASRRLKEMLIKKKWVVTLFPTHAHAMDADMSLREFEDFVYRATFADQDQPIRAWKALARKQAKLIKRLEGADRVQILGPDTDLTLSVRGRTFINSDGIHNMPSGEVFTGPQENSAEGHIRFDFPVCHAGREIDGIRLTFRRGKVVEAHAAKNNAFLQQMLGVDPGARRLGELGIGTNFGIQRFIKNILFDEKIGGTIHLALGQSYAETGGTNKSAIHWDMIKDLRKGGTVLVDGREFQKDGRFAGGF